MSESARRDFRRRSPPSSCMKFRFVLLGPDDDQDDSAQERAATRRWVPQGTRIGWITGSNLFLEPALSYQVAQQLAGTERIPLSEQTLRHRLREHGLLASIDAGRQMLQVRRILDGSPRQVLHLNAVDLLGGRKPVQMSSSRTSLPEAECRVCRAGRQCVAERPKLLVPNSTVIVRKRGLPGNQ